jgi:hypothetical protein
MKVIKILALRANPTNTSSLRLDEEIRGIKDELERAKYRDRFEFISEGAVRADDLSRAMLKYKPDIVHFSGHGAGELGLALEDDVGNMQLVSTEALNRLFKWGRNTVKCVFLNACYSQVQAEAIHQNIDCVIGMNKAIGDRAAIKFAAKFYQALVDGESFQSAYDYACTALDLSGSKESSTPELLNRKEGNDPLSIGIPTATPTQQREEVKPQLPSQPQAQQSHSIGNITIGGNDNPSVITQASGNSNVSQNNSRQSMNVSGSTISGQIGQAGGDLTQTQYQSSGGAEKQLTTAEVIQLIGQIEGLLKSSALPDEQKNKVILHLETVKEEAEAKEPDKQYAAKSLQKATKI